MEQQQFISRLVQLRLDKDVSAREVSLSLGLSPGYINNIENSVNYPSMSVFFNICDYFNITPKDFFDTGATHPAKVDQLLSLVREMDNAQLDHLIAIAADMRK